MGPPSEAPAKRLEGKKTDVTDKNRRQPSEKRRVPGGPAKTHEGKNPPVPGEKILHLLVPEGQRSYEPSPIFPQPAGPGTKFEIFFRSQNSNLPTPASTSRPWRYLTMSDFQRSTQGGPFLGGSLYSRRTAVPGAVLPSQFLEASDATAVNRARPITNSFVEPVFITFQNQDFVLTECVLVCALKRYIHPGADKDNRGVGDKDGNDEGDVENSGGEPSTTTPRIAVVPSSSNLTPRQRQRQQQRQRQKAKRAQEKQQQQQQHKKEKPDMLDDDTVSEVLKAYRTTWAPINVTGLYDRLMDPQQPQREALEKWLNGSEEEMKKFALWWYRAWLNTMTAIYKRFVHPPLHSHIRLLQPLFSSRSSTYTISPRYTLHTHVPS